MTRTDADGYAYKGSQRQLQDFVNDYPSELNREIFGAIASLPRSAGLRWVSPLKDSRKKESQKTESRDKEYQEYSDEKFLAAVRQTSLSFELQRFWPNGGPTWDALAIVYTGGTSGVLLVEAKAHPAELESSCKAKDKISIRKIQVGLDAANAWLGADKSSDWYKQYYQAANRLAHLYFLREIAKIPAWLANIYFVDDASHISTRRVEWDRTIAEVEKRLGLRRGSSPYAGNVFLPSKKITTTG